MAVTQGANFSIYDHGTHHERDGSWLLFVNSLPVKSEDIGVLLSIIIFQSYLTQKDSTYSRPFRECMVQKRDLTIIFKVCLHLLSAEILKVIANAEAFSQNFLDVNQTWKKLGQGIVLHMANVISNMVIRPWKSKTNNLHTKHHTLLLGLLLNNNKHYSNASSRAGYNYLPTLYLLCSICSEHSGDGMLYLYSQFRGWGCFVCMCVCGSSLNPWDFFPAPPVNFGTIHTSCSITHNLHPCQMTFLKTRRISGFVLPITQFALISHAFFSVCCVCQA